MARSGGPTVGLDIGSKYIKVAEVVPSRNGVAVRALGMAPTPPGALEAGVIVDAKLLGDAIKKLLKEAGVGTRSCVSSVSGSGALVVRVIEVPKMSDSELAETMKWEVERHVPFAANEVIMDFQAIQRTDDDPDAQNMEVLLAVAQQDMVDKHVEALFAAGLQPRSIDVEPLAASRCLVELGPDPWGKKTVVVVNIGASITDIGIFRDGVLSFPRTLPLAGDAMTSSIMSQTGLEADAAEDLKLQHAAVLMGRAPAAPAPQASVAGASDFGFVDFSSGDDSGLDLAAPTLGEPEPAPVPVATPMGDPTTVQVFGAIAPTLGDLLSEIRRSIEYYRGRSSDGHIDQVLLCGGSARIKDLDKFLAGELGVPTQIADVFKFAPVSAKSVTPDYLETIGPSFAVAVGLGARDMVAAPASAAPSGRGKRKK
ncbi:MAG: type IV pilus assembly protein PilM [Armatimonadetes bacterium]|nr:type IV pilus assembly protein PilM [Armatimonadota bacterium]